MESCECRDSTSLDAGKGCVKLSKLTFIIFRRGAMGHIYHEKQPGSQNKNKPQIVAPSVSGEL